MPKQGTHQQVPRVQNHGKRESTTSVPRVQNHDKRESTASAPKVEKEQKERKSFIVQHQPSHFHQNATIIQQLPQFRYINKLQVPRRLDGKPDKAARWKIACENGFERMITAKAPYRTYRTIANHATQQYASSNCTKLLKYMWKCAYGTQTYASNKISKLKQGEYHYLRRNFARVRARNTHVCEGVLIQG